MHNFVKYVVPAIPSIQINFIIICLHIHHISSHFESEMCLKTWSLRHCCLHYFYTLQMLFLSKNALIGKICFPGNSFKISQLQNHLTSYLPISSPSEEEICLKTWHSRDCILFMRLKAVLELKMHSLVKYVFLLAISSKQVNSNIICLHIYHISNHSEE